MIARRTRVHSFSGPSTIHEWGMDTPAILALPWELRSKISREWVSTQVWYYIKFDTEEEAALFKLTYL